MIFHHDGLIQVPLAWRQQRPLFIAEMQGDLRK